MPDFKIEQIALYPPDPAAAKKLLGEMGAGEWANDIVVATGEVFGERGTNVADLAFDYTLGADREKALELEVLHYRAGRNWMDDGVSQRPRVSHLGMHCSEAELRGWDTFFRNRGIGVAQAVVTESHANPAIAGKRWYKYVIFDTYPILGVDIKFIVRRDTPPGGS